MYSIYAIISPSNKVYIGQSKNIKQRYRAYKANTCKTQYHIYRSILKYSFNAHVFIVLHDDLLQEEANSLEIEYISIFKSLGVSLNIKDGGHLNFNFKTKPVLKLNYNYDIIEEYSSIVEASLKNNISSGLINTAISTKRHHCSGFIWCLKAEYSCDFKINKPIKKKKGSIYKFNFFVIVK
jgi:hypothetical protein